MAFSDVIANSVIVVCVVLGILGTFKWLVRLFAGALLGIVVLCVVALLSANPKFNELSKGLFREGVVVPCVRQQITMLIDRATTLDVCQTVLYLLGVPCADYMQGRALVEGMNRSYVSEH